MHLLYVDDIMFITQPSKEVKFLFSFYTVSMQKGARIKGYRADSSLTNARIGVFSISRRRALLRL